MIRDLGAYIVTDDGVFGAQPRFRGTRIFVKDVLFYVAKGKDWDWIVWAYDGKVPREAIAEAVELAARAFEEQQEGARASA